jgi:hypothetical protein
MMKAQQDLESKEVEGTAGGGMVKVKMNGAGLLLSIKLDPQAVDPKDVEMLEDLVVAAVKNANEKVKELSNAVLGNVTGGMQFPGLG